VKNGVRGISLKGIFSLLSIALFLTAAQGHATPAFAVDNGKPNGAAPATDNVPRGAAAAGKREERRQERCRRRVRGHHRQGSGARGRHPRHRNRGVRRRSELHDSGAPLSLGMRFLFLFVTLYSLPSPEGAVGKQLPSCSFTAPRVAQLRKDISHCQ